MDRLASDAALRAQLGERALQVARRRYSPENFDKIAFAFCDLAERFTAGASHPGGLSNRAR
jgi:hypothetical protein